MNEIVLVVDDNPKNLQLISTVLSSSYQLLLANNGEKALRIADAKLPDLILLDIMMPGENGYEVCKKLKISDKTKDIPVIFLTAKAEEEDIVMAFEVGGVDYIIKPFKSKEVLARIKTQLDLKNAQDKLQMQNDELKELLANRDKFFSIISHNLRSPFNALLNLSQLLIEEKDEINLEDRDIMIENIYKSSETAFALVDDLIRWVRIQTGEHIFKPEFLSLSNMLLDIIHNLRKDYENKKISIITKFEKPEQIIFFDRESFMVVVNNLLSNAIKFSNEGGTIQIGYKERDGQLFIFVKDNGTGMPKLIQDKVFKIEENISARGTNKEKGSGLGLIICKELVERNYGEICFESVEQSGSTFYILANSAPFHNVMLPNHFKSELGKVC
jgi:two-component system sensor histidine kinase/response regulator